MFFNFQLIQYLRLIVTIISNRCNSDKHRQIQQVYIIISMRPSNNYRQSQASTNVLSQPGSRQSQSSAVSSQKPKSKVLYFNILSILLLVKLRKSIKKRRHREKVLEQWYNTECTYNLDLNIALRNIRMPMEKMNIIDKDQAQILFPEIEGMIQLSGMMLKSIQEARKVKNPNKIMLGKEIGKFVNGYKLYGGYFGSHCKSSKLLAELTQHKQEEMKTIEQNMQAELERKQSKKLTMTIKDCMEQPLYRLFKYVLLLKEYLKKLPKHHPDYNSILNCHNAFHDINNINNELMKKIQDQQKKVKLDKLFGEALKENRFLISEMQASTIYFDAKLYIFNDLVIIAKVESFLGTEREEKYGNFQLNQFSYVAEQDDLKYFKNILILITKENCIHLFFPDEGTRCELLKCLQKDFRDLRIKEHERRKLQDNQKNIKAKKISFTLQQQDSNQFFLLQPEFRVQIIGQEVRPISTLSNDTVYITRFMIPQYYQDQLNFLESQGIPSKSPNEKLPSRQTQTKKFALQRFSSLPFQFQMSEQQLHHKSMRGNNIKCLNQVVQIHFSVLQQIYKQMKNICPDRLPDIDPITKDVNIYAKGKRKTKAFEMRKFFIEEFLNFIFRHPTIMSNPIWFISKLRINEDIWNYSTQRNSQLKRQTREGEKSYGFDNCSICKRAKIDSIQEFEHFRSFYTSSPDHRTNKDHDRYCFNFYNLLRVRLLSFNYICFNTLERIQLFYHYLEGRLDYPFTMHRCNQKTGKIVKIYLPSLDDNFVSVVVDSKSTVGEILEEIGNMFKMKNSFQYDLMGNYNGKTRLLDRDQFFIDVIKCLSIDFEECSLDKKQVIKPNQEKSGFFDTLKGWKNQIFSKQGESNKIYFIKTTYLHKSLQIKSFQFNSEKKKLEVQKIFWAIKKGLIKLSQNEFTQIAALFYCLRELDGIQHFSITKIATKTLQKITPTEHLFMVNSSQKFKGEISKLIDQEKSSLLKNNKNTGQIHMKIIEIAFKTMDYITYFIQADIKQMPENIIPKSQLPMSCLIGINYRSFIITRNAFDTSPLKQLKLSEMEHTLSVFSLFIECQSESYRFDGKMFYHFAELIKKYKMIAKKFPQHNA